MEEFEGFLITDADGDHDAGRDGDSAEKKNGIDLSRPKSKAGPRPQSGAPSVHENDKMELLAGESEVATNTGAEVPSQAGKVTDVQATVAEDDVAKITPLREHVPVDEGVFGLAGSGESTCRINDAR